MTDAQARCLAPGDYVASLNMRCPSGFKVTHVDADPGRLAPPQIVVNQLYGDDWVLAAAFRKVDGPKLTRREIAALHAEQDDARAAIALDQELSQGVAA